MSSQTGGRIDTWLRKQLMRRVQTLCSVLTGHKVPDPTDHALQRCTLCEALVQVKR